MARGLPTSRTGRGYHVWHRGRGVYRLCGKGEYIGTAGHYVVAPPSYHPHARRLYEWLVPLPDLGTPLPELDPTEAGLLPLGTGIPRPCAGPSKVCRKRTVRSGYQCITPHLHAVVRGCLPAGPGERHRCLLELVRQLDAASLGEEHLELLFELWWGFAEPVVRTKDRRTSWRELNDAWRRSQERRAAGLASGRLIDVVALAESVTVPPPFQQPRTLHRLYQLHAAMQQLAGNRPHFMSCYLAAELLGDVSHQTAWRWQKCLRQAGVLVRTKVGERRPGGRASEWLLVVFQEQTGNLACAR